MKRLLLAAALCLMAASTLSAQAIVGAWYVGDTSSGDSDVLVFFSNGYYMHMNDDDTGGLDGYERGTYTWSGVNGTSFTVMAIADINGDNGLSHNDNTSATISITGDIFTATDFDGEGTGDSILTRVTGAKDIVGAWYEGDITANDSTAVVVFMSNLTYFTASDEGTDGDGHPGIERGSYTWVSDTGEFTSSTAVDTDGSSGFSGAPFITNITISGDIMYLTDSEETGTFNSVTAVPEPSTYAVIAGVFVLGIAALRRRKQS